MRCHALVEPSALHADRKPRLIIKTLDRRQSRLEGLARNGQSTLGLILPNFTRQTTFLSPRGRVGLPLSGHVASEPIRQGSGEMQWLEGGGWHGWVPASAVANPGGHADLRASHACRPSGLWRQTNNSRSGQSYAGSRTDRFVLLAIICSTEQSQHLFRHLLQHLLQHNSSRRLESNWKCCP